MVFALLPAFLVATVVSLLLVYLFAVDPVAFETFNSSLLANMILAMSFVLCMLVLLSFFGTWLPSVVVGGDRRLSSAFARGEATFEASIVQMMVWVMPLFFVTAIAYWVGDGPAVLPDGSVLWGRVAANALAVVLEILRLALVAVVISRVYVAHEASVGRETPVRPGTVT